MILEMLRWWYGPGLILSVHRIGAWTAAVEHTFSVGILLRTLFSPWRRIITPKGRGIDAQVRAALDNFVSRCVGFVIRCFALLFAAVAGLFAFLGGVVGLVLWPLVPPLIIYCLVRSITG
jgi:hypothetical protein